MPDDLEERGDRGSLVSADTRDPVDASLESEQRRTVLAALNSLPAEQRAALVLVDMEGYPVAEVAQMLDCAEGTVKSRCARGRAKLAVLLGHLRAADHDEDPQLVRNPEPDSAVLPHDPGRGPPP